ncbi:hypothetical protein HPP92_027487 [Vanilla planifolia]|uniref:Uncharacterized protein n=1 Tax=Vanilla planifolia TaxID=51239 RepID=A0A835PB49_VANPL|nr:hypothetical protein HPP92_027487 [Vanilla planifolia]
MFKGTLEDDGNVNSLSGDEAKELMSLKCVNLEVKAWLADKDAEALRCQKLLVEEEEAAQKRMEGSP